MTQKLFLLFGLELFDIVQFNDVREILIREVVQNSVKFDGVFFFPVLPNRISILREVEFQQNKIRIQLMRKPELVRSCQFNQRRIMVLLPSDGRRIGYNRIAFTVVREFKNCRLPCSQTANHLFQVLVSCFSSLQNVFTIIVVKLRFFQFSGGNERYYRRNQSATEYRSNYRRPVERSWVGSLKKEHFANSLPTKLLVHSQANGNH